MTPSLQHELIEDRARQDALQGAFVKARIDHDHKIERRYHEQMVPTVTHTPSFYYPTERPD